MIPAIMEGMGSKCSNAETTAGWYGSSEITTPYSPIIVELNASLEGKQYVVRSIYSTSREFPGAFGEPEAAKALFEAMRKATSALANQLRQ